MVVADRVPEEVFRKNFRVFHLKKHLSSAEIPSILVLQQFRLLTEHTAEVGGCLEEGNIALGELTVDGNAYSRFEMRVLGVPLDHIERHCAVREKHLSCARVDL